MWVDGLRWRQSVRLNKVQPVNSSHIYTHMCTCVICENGPVRLKVTNLQVLFSTFVVAHQGVLTIFCFCIQTVAHFNILYT